MSLIMVRGPCSGNIESACFMMYINGNIYLFRRIIKDQFERIRDADRFWFENTENEIFSAEEIASIKDITLWDVIVNSTDIKEDEVQRKVIINLTHNF